MSHFRRVCSALPYSKEVLNPWRLRLLHQLHLLGTVRAVADAVHLSPSSVSQQLAVLESEVQAQLFERVGRRIRLTPVGVVLAGHAAEILDHLESVEADIASLHAEPTGLVRIAAFTSSFHSILVPAVLRLRSEHPRISVEVREAEPIAGLDTLRRGETDVVVAAEFGDVPVSPDPLLVRVPLSGDRVVLVASRDRDDLAGATGLAALASEAWAFELPGAHLADLAERLCLRAGFVPRVVGRFDSHGALLRHVEAGLSVTLLPLLAVDDRHAVQAIPLPGLPPRNIQLVTRRGATSRVAVRETVAALRGAAREALPAGPTT